MSLRQLRSLFVVLGSLGIWCADATARASVVATDFELRGALVQGGYAIGRIPERPLTLHFAGEAVEVAPDGRFIIGFGRNAPRTGQLEARRAGGTVLQQVVVIEPRRFESERVRALARRNGSPPSADDARRRRSELSRIRQARRGTSLLQNWSQPFQWPTLGRISGRFGTERLIPGERPRIHFGVDVAAPTGTRVLAPAGGKVRLAAQDFSAEGGIIILDHGHGLASTFLHLSQVRVKTGEHVNIGQPIGAVGSTGRSTGPHLHWAMHWKRTRIDPELFVEPMDQVLARLVARVLGPSDPTSSPTTAAGTKNP